MSEESTVLHMKLPKKSLTVFKELTKEKYKRKYTDMLREIIQAFNEGRLRIKLSEGQINQQQELYEEKDPS